MNAEAETARLEFGGFRFEPSKGLLFRDGELVRLGRRSAQLLGALLRRRGEVLTKAELIDTAWSGDAVEESNLSVQIAQLRKVLGPTGDGKAWIATVPRVGYRFAASEGAQMQWIPPERSKLPSLAVLAFDNLGGDPSQQYFADGIVEDLITGLARFRTFDVIARNSSFAYRGRPVDVRHVARDLGVHYVLEGSIRRAGQRLRVTAQLVDGEDGSHVWADNFDGPTEGIFDVQDRIVACVVATLEPRIGQAEIARSRRQRPQSLAAYDLYLRGLFLLQTLSPENSARAFGLFSEALAIEPENVMFLTGATEALTNRITQGFPAIGPDDRQMCLDLAQRGLRLAGDDATAIAMFGLGLIAARQHALGYATVQRAVALNPNGLMILLIAGSACVHCGSLADAEAYLERASTLSANEPWQRFVFTWLAHLSMIRGDYETALARANKSLSIAQSFGKARWISIAANFQLGRLSEAHRQLATFQADTPGVTVGSILEGVPTLDPQRMASIIEGLRGAGLTES